MSNRQQETQMLGAQPLPVGRRSFVKGFAALGAGLAASAMLPKAARAQSTQSPASPNPTAGTNRASDVMASDATTVVEITSGKIRGFRRKGIYAFKGVPYGASTSGANRFVAPAPPEPWVGIRNALAYGRACYQETAQSKGGGPHSTFDSRNLAPSDEDNFLLHRGCSIYTPGEDCLRLNVWTPEINGSGKRPVMVYMHGGGFEGGFDMDLLSYDGENLSRNQDVVVVTHNHRLNVFGYLNLREIGGGKYADSANAGMLDIVAVLKWVRANIANLGGDPGNVTIFGQSGGGGKVLTLMAMPSAKGLFHKAICQSGPFLKALESDYSAQVADNRCGASLRSDGDGDEQAQSARFMGTRPQDRAKGMGPHRRWMGSSPSPVRPGGASGSSRRSSDLGHNPKRDRVRPRPRGPCRDDGCGIASESSRDAG
jgi:para-nitrobenzyl esterase